jgi:hypothetical protein
MKLLNLISGPQQETRQKMSITLYLQFKLDLLVIRLISSEKVIRENMILKIL